MVDIKRVVKLLQIRTGQLKFARKNNWALQSKLNNIRSVINGPYTTEHKIELLKQIV